MHAATVGPTNDPGRAARRIMTDDGFNIGVLFAGDREPYRNGPKPARGTVTELEGEFAL